MANPRGRALTLAHRQQLARVASGVRRAVEQVASTVNPADVDRWWVAAGPRVLRVVSAASTACSAAAERYLVAHGAAHGVEVAVVRSGPAAEQIATSLRVTGPVAWKIAFADSGGDAGRATASMRTQLAGAAVRLALAGERETVMATIAADDGAP